MPHDPDRVRLRHMLDHAREAVELVRGRTRQNLDDDRLLGLALVRLLEIVGEAAGRMSDGARAARSQIPWGGLFLPRARYVRDPRSSTT